MNGASNPATRGTVMQLFGTGQGFIQDAPQTELLRQALCRQRRSRRSTWAVLTS